MATRREVIRFDAEPVKVKLDKGPHAGIECRGQYGIDWRYSVNHGKSVMYCPQKHEKPCCNRAPQPVKKWRSTSSVKGGGKRNGSHLIFRFVRNPRLSRRRKQTSRPSHLRQHVDYRNGCSHVPNRRLLRNRHPHPNPLQYLPLP